MNLFEINIAIVCFIVGNFLGLNYSYNKYPFPYVENKIDMLALILSILGGILLNTPLYDLGILLLSFPFGMRPGYGRIEFILGLSLAIILYLVKKWMLIGNI
ncbi:hypothetical protein J422_05763 [Methanocaldococcus villosus KIN24-T80]|uniref:Uncharacterized protein n=1 Tax=Methanocaldococcus villosus KIN24-T80 TaxID=1069083 RepID=N6V0G9_9EURY|nr:energy-converting hydrogenase subunit EhaL family protein [Methanocaldococcus villosus]ENN95818.1 hypothetical protein J422_05763 [Methanocaldococcus villosus KIN24-T80]